MLKRGDLRLTSRAASLPIRELINIRAYHTHTSEFNQLYYIYMIYVSINFQPSTLINKKIMKRRGPSAPHKGRFAFHRKVYPHACVVGRLHIRGQASGRGYQSWPSYDIERAGRPSVPRSVLTGGLSCIINIE